MGLGLGLGLGHARRLLRGLCELLQPDVVPALGLGDHASLLVEQGAEGAWLGVGVGLGLGLGLG